MSTLVVVLALTLLGGLGGLLVAAAFLLLNETTRTRLVPWLVSYAVGALLGVALLNLLPEALTFLAPSAVFATLLGGILVFFVLEKLVLIRHCHTDACQVHGATAALVIIGDDEVAKDQVTVRRYQNNQQRSFAIPEFLELLVKEITQRIHVRDWAQLQ